MSVRHETRPVQAVLFDLDGTLLDTAPGILTALNHVLSTEHLPEKTLVEVREFVTLGTEKMLRHVMPEDLPAERLKKLTRTFLIRYKQTMYTGSAPFKGIQPLLDWLDLEHYPWGVVTNKLTAFSRPLLERLGLLRRLACLVSGDSAEHSKPHPDPMWLASKTLGIATHRCVYFGDSHSDVLASRAAGMMVVVASYGYIAPHTDPRSWEGDEVLKEPLAMKRWLLLKNSAPPIDGGADDSLSS